MAQDLFAPPTDEELRAARAPAQAPQTARNDLFAPPSKQELVDGGALFAPPTEAELAGAGAEQRPNDQSDITELAEQRNDHVVSGADIEHIARKHGVAPEFLRSATGWMSGVLDPRERRGAEHVTESLKSTLGSAAEGVLMGVPQALYKKFGVQDENQRRALDDLQKLIEERKSTGQAISEMGLGLVAPVGLGAKLVKEGTAAAKLAHAAEATGIGAAAGWAHSDEDNELLSTLVGAGVGLGLAGLAGGVSRLVGKFAKKAAPEVERAVVEGAQDTVAAARARLQENAQAEEVLADVVTMVPEVREAGRTNDFYKFIDAVDPSEVARLASLAPEGAELPARLVKSAGEDAAKAWVVVRGAVNDLDKVLGVGGRRGGVRDVISQEGSERVGQQFRLMREGKYVADELAKVSEQAVGRPGFLGKVAGFISDARYVYDAIDRRLGTRLTPIIDRLSAASNHFTGDMAATATLQKGLNKLLLRAEKEPTVAGAKFDLYSALERTGSELSSEYTPAQKQAITAWRDAFETLRQHANDLGLPVAKLETGYVPHKVVDPLEFVRRMEMAGEKLGLRLSNVEKKAYTDLDDDVLQAVLDRAASGDKLAADFVQGMKLAKGGDVQNVFDARAALNTMLDLSRTGHNLETVAGAALKREGGIPAWLLERDVPKLFQKWAHSTFRHARMREGIDQLAAAAEAIEDKHPEATAYIRRHIEDLVGIRSGSAEAAKGEAVSRWQMRLERAARKAGEDTVKGRFYLQAAKMPDLIPFFTSQIYPYALGMKLNKVLENLTQPFVVGIPSVGLKNSDYFARGTVDMLTHYAESFGKGRMGLKKFLEAKGLAPADQPFEAHKWIKEGLERSPLRKVGATVLEATNKWAMLLYQQSDLMTRGVSYHAARRIAADMQRGTPKALQIIDEMGPGWAAEVRDQLAKGQDVTDSVAHWLNGYTMFNYNRVSMSEYGRFLGSLFSTFSKWPTSIAGDIFYRMDKVAQGDAKLSPEMMKLGMKYLAPWVAFKALQTAVSDKLEESPRAQQVVGRDVSRVAPLGSVGMLMEGPFKAPAPRALTEVGKAVLEGDVRTPGRYAHAVGGAVLRNLMPFTPGGVWVRFLYKDLPGWQDEEVPAGSPARLLLEDAGVDMEAD